MIAPPAPAKREIRGPMQHKDAAVAEASPVLISLFFFMEFSVFQLLPRWRKMAGGVFPFSFLGSKKWFELPVLLKLDFGLLAFLNVEK